ncbi:MAG: TolC family protein, partial [Schleiferiaceae bacterium]
AELDIQKAEAALAEAMEQVRLDSVSGGFSLKAYAQEMAYRSKAVEISQATVASTEKAYEAGVAKATDVVNAILASFDVQRQRLNLHMTLSEQSLNYQLSKGVRPADAMTLTQSLFNP